MQINLIKLIYKKDEFQVIRATGLPIKSIKKEDIGIPNEQTIARQPGQDAIHTQAESEQGLHEE